MNGPTRLFLYASAAAAFGCVDPAEDGAVQGGETPVSPDPTSAPLQLTFHLASGELAPGAVFARKDAVHLRTSLAEGATSFDEGDLAFVVLDAFGKPLSKDRLECRRFHVGSSDARITEVYAGFDVTGVPCLHGWSVHQTGTLLPRLDPFSEAPPNTHGVTEYTVVVARVEHVLHDVFPPDAVRANFFVEAGPSCGDGHVDQGEACDDGNTADGDGCSGSCEVEHCCPSHCCGNGVVESGEECDDGNKTGGDGCSSSCKVEIIL